jgi:hypothetical protein
VLFFYLTVFQLQSTDSLLDILIKNILNGGAFENFFLFFFILAVSFTGCTSIYTVNNYPSKKIFYNDFNNSILSKNLTISLVNGSSFIVKPGAFLLNDTLFTASNVVTIDKIKTVSYKNNFRGAFWGAITGTGIGLIALLNFENSFGATVLFESIVMSGSLLSGGILGWLIGWNTVYQFNP